MSVATDRPIRLTVVMTHPVQYYAPWFRDIAARAPALDLTVLYATRPTPAKQGAGFGRPFEWDVPLTDGYRSEFVREPRATDSVDAHDFFGTDAPEVAAALAGTRPDVVLVPGWHSATLIRALVGARRLNVPLLYRGDTHLGNAPPGWRRRAWRIRTRAFLSRYDGYLAVGTRARQYLESFGVAGDRIWSSPHAVHNDFFAGAAAAHQTRDARRAARNHFRFDDQAFVALFVGKLEAKKHAIDAIRAAARMNHPTRVLIVGAGCEEGACRDEAARLGVDVRFAGFLNQTEIARAYAAADCLVLPSDWGETWGLVVNEAMATGLPAIVSDRVGCAPDLVDRDTGGQFTFGDIDDLALTLSSIRDRQKGGHDYGHACRERIARHSFERATTGLVAACEALARRHSPSVVVCAGQMVAMTGLERMTFELVRILRDRQARVHCIVNTWDNRAIVAAAERLGASWSTGYYWYPLRLQRARNPIRLLQMAWDVAQTSRGLMATARRVGATHVLVTEHVVAIRNAPALLWLRLTGVRVVMKLANAPADEPFYRRLWRWAVNPLITVFVCNSRFTESELLAHGVARQKTLMIHNMAPHRAPDGREPRQRVEADPGRVVYVGQIIPDKGVDILLDAVALLAARGRDVRLDVVGRMDGWVAPEYLGYREALLARAARPDLNGRVRFLGWQDDVRQFLRAAAVHCAPSLPSTREGFGLVNLEAKLAKVPSVVFRSGAFPEVVQHGVTGWVCDTPTVDALAEGLDYFLSDPARARQIGDAAWRSAEAFSADRYEGKWASVFGLPPARAAHRLAPDDRLGVRPQADRSASELELMSSASSRASRPNTAS